MGYAILIYIIGFVMTMMFLWKFGKQIGFDYDKPKNYVNHDDWDSNKQAYTVFSAAWPVFMPVLSVFGLFIGAGKLGGLLSDIIQQLIEGKPKKDNDNDLKIK